MNNIIFIDAPSGAGKSKYITRKLKEYERDGLRTLYLSGREMVDMMILGANILKEGGTDTPLMSFELEYDVVAVDDVDLSFGGVCYIKEDPFGGSGCFDGQLVEFALNMANKGKTVILSGINLKQRMPGICKLLNPVSKWLDITELSK